MAEQTLHLKVTLRIYSDDDQRCFGPGIATLLQRVREHHSLRAGAASMEMAYSKAWRIIRTAEAVFGCKLLSSTIGGPHGGGAVLTPEAERLLAAYETFCATWDLSGLAADYESLLLNKDRPVRVLDPKGNFEGTARGINEKGELLVERQDGRLECVYAGEVSVRGVYGYV